MEQGRTNLNLDVGCEHVLRGNVNVDLTKPTFIHSKTFIKADGQHLPFRDRIFEKTTSHHLIEHVENPYRLLDELIRVTKNKVIVKCPHRYSLIAKSFEHKHYFNKTWFANVLSKKNIKFRIYTTLDRERDILKFPLEITVTIWKQENEKDETMKSS